MGKRSNQASGQRQHRNGQEAYEKILDSISPGSYKLKQPNHHTPMRGATIQNTNTKHQGRCGATGTLTAGENTKWFSHCGRQFGGFSQS